MRRLLPKQLSMMGSLFTGHAEPNGWSPPIELPDLSVYPKSFKFGFDTEFRARNQ